MINIAWMYPDILNLHGERGNAMAFDIISKKLGIDVKITRIDNLKEKIDFDKFDILLFNAGELKHIKEVIKSLNSQIKDLKKYISDKKIIFATGTSGAILANTITRLDGTTINGLNLLDIDIKERSSVIGDDLYYTFNGMEIVSSQIQMIDIDIKKEIPFGDIIYGYGNIGNKSEGVIKDNIIFTNSLGPVLVKNPWLCEYILDLAIKTKKIDITKKEVDYEIEKKSLESVKEFINKKINNK